MWRAAFARGLEEDAGDDAGGGVEGGEGDGEDEEADAREGGGDAVEVAEEDRDGEGGEREEGDLEVVDDQPAVCVELEDVVRRVGVEALEGGQGEGGRDGEERQGRTAAAGKAVVWVGAGVEVGRG